MENEGTAMETAAPMYVKLEEGQTRVLCLHPGVATAPLEAHLETIDIGLASNAAGNLRTIDPPAGKFEDDDPLPWRKFGALIRAYGTWHFDLTDTLPGDLQLFLTYVLDPSIVKGERHLRRVHRHMPNPLRRLWRRRTGIEDFDRDRYDPHPDVGAAPYEAIERVKKVREANDMILNTLEVEGIKPGSVFDENLGRRIPTTAENPYDALIAAANATQMKSNFKREARVLEATAAGAYEAVSYCWGELDTSATLFMTHCDENIKISETLRQMLEQLRSSNTVRRLWIDAVCIDQSNDDEKDLQISQMATIYGSAIRVIIWLGVPDETTKWAFATLHGKSAADGAGLTNRFVDSMIHVDRMIKHYPFCQCCGLELDGGSESGEPSTKGITGIRNLLQRPWFTRLWVVQELISARYAEIHCGSHSIPWHRTDLVELAKDYFRSNLPMLNELERSTSMRQMEYSPSNLTWWIATFASKKCTVPKDRIFAIQSISGLGRQHISRIHYRLPIEDLYTIVAEHILTSNYTWKPVLRVSSETFSCTYPPSSVLGLVGTCKSTIHLPSWVPDFGALTNRSQGKLEEYFRTEMYIDILRERFHGRSAHHLCVGAPIDFAKESFEVDMQRRYQNRRTEWSLKSDFLEKEAQKSLSHLDASLSCVSSNTGRELYIKGCPFAVVTEVLPDSSCPEELNAAYKAPLSTLPQSQGTNLLLCLQRWVQRCDEFNVRVRGSNLEGNVKLMQLLNLADEENFPEKYRKLLRSWSCNEQTARTTDYLSRSDVEQDCIEDFRLELPFWQLICNYLEHLNNSVPTANPARDQSQRDEVFNALRKAFSHDENPEIFHRNLGGLDIGGECVVGWIPSSARSQDVILVCPGAPRAFVLRHIQNSNAFQLLGDCFIPEVNGRNAYEYCNDLSERNRTVVLR